MIRLALLAAWIGSTGCIISNHNAVCGDGVRDPGEECDDGDNTNGDGCSAVCTVEPYCGDGLVDPGEACDDGNNASNDGCSSTCTVEPVCGDGHLDPGEACDDHNTAPSDGCSATCTIEHDFATTAHWSFRTIAGTTVACPVGFDTVAVVSQPLGTSGQPVGSPFIDLFDCAGGQGTISPVLQGRYLTHINVTNAAGTQTYASSLSAVVDLTAGNQTFTAQILTNGGYFGFAWTLRGAASNNVLSCAQVTGGIDGVELISTLNSSTSATTDIFDCTDGAGVTAGLATGTYTVSIDAMQNNAAIGIAPALLNKVIMAPNKVTDLGTVTIPIDGQ
jgi:cysteine-rich repeat protein